jgi:hypothetical protein
MIIFSSVTRAMVPMLCCCLVYHRVLFHLEDRAKWERECLSRRSNGLDF